MRYLDYLNSNVDLFLKARKLTQFSAAIYEALFQSGVLNGVSKLLGISAREGELELFLTKKLGIKLGYMEECFDFNLVFKNELFRQGRLLSILDSHQGDFLSYPFLERYDLALSNGSWHGHFNNKAVLDRVMKALKLDGKLVILLPLRESPDCVIAQKSAVENIGLSAEEISTWLQINGYNSHLWPFEFKIKAEKCFDSPQIPYEWQSYVEFLLGKSWTQLNDQERHELLLVLRTAREGENLHMKAGLVIVNRRP